jgi:hypothetical protein
LLLRLLLLARIHFGQLRRGRFSSLIFPILHRLLLLLPCLFSFCWQDGLVPPMGHWQMIAVTNGKMKRSLQ